MKDVRTAYETAWAKFQEEYPQIFFTDAQVARLAFMLGFLDGVNVGIKILDEELAMQKERTNT